MLCDDWRPTASIENVRLRAELLARTRQFFAARDVLEVETPLLSVATASDPHLQSFVTRYNGPGLPPDTLFYLQTSPEAAMKRLLAAGSGSIYQVCKAFRDGESGTHHNPEFTMLEWYRVGFDHFTLMDEVEALVKTLLDLDCEFEKMSYQAIFERYLGLDPHRAPLDDLMRCANDSGISIDLNEIETERDGWLDLLMSHLIEPHLGQSAPLFIYDYPASQAALAKVRPGEVALAERFELYITGVELANGYHELCDDDEFSRRFEQDTLQRKNNGGFVPGINHRLSAALESGLPESAGVALGFDRLLMLAAGRDSISGVVIFTVANA
ncbi:MAG: EF-P lysine aminoacylase GenX [Gammaproteobacteria bacterium]|nr:EF-P lysine aminoacylase GenX [Gammaproteobacteria bacterium]